MKLLSDIARCMGDSFDPLCQTCARRQQLYRDDPLRWYHYMDVTPINGQCEYRIAEADHA
jgi:hypothetical protein